MGLYKNVMTALDIAGVDVIVTKAVVVDCDEVFDAATLGMSSDVNVTRLSPTRLLVGLVAAPNIDTVLAALAQLPEAQREELLERLGK